MASLPPVDVSLNTNGYTHVLQNIKVAQANGEHMISNVKRRGREGVERGRGKHVAYYDFEK